MSKTADELQQFNRMWSELSSADQRDIIKAREIPKEAWENKTLLADFYFSETGILKQLETLSNEEHIFLHYLASLNTPQKIHVAGIVYPPINTDFNLTYTGQYKETLKILTKRLVKKGLLIIYTGSSGNDSKLERLRLALPSNVINLLPPLLKTEIEKNYIPEKDIIRSRFLLLNSTINSTTYSPFMIQIKNGDLKLNSQPYTFKTLYETLFSLWIERLFKKYSITDELKLSFHYLYSEIPIGGVIDPNSFNSICKIFFPKQELTGKTFCASGVEFGLLTNSFSRVQFQSTLIPSYYIEAKDKETVSIDLDKIPFDVLEKIAAISDLKIKDEMLLASPNRFKISRQLMHEKMNNQPYIDYLKKISSSYKKNIDSLQERKGKTIVHKNLFIAKIKNLSLRVKLEKAFPDKSQFISLSNDFVAFPIACLSIVEKITKQAGHVIKIERGK